jgi:hypothetical protein
LRKREDNIFAEIGRQVHAVLPNHHGIVAVPRQETAVVREPDGVFEGAQAAGALTGELQFDLALHQEPFLVTFYQELVAEGACGVDEIVETFKVELIDGQFPGQAQFLVFEMAKVDKQGHRIGG